MDPEASQIDLNQETVTNPATLSPTALLEDPAKPSLASPDASKPNEPAAIDASGGVAGRKETPMASLVRKARQTARELLGWSFASTFLAFLVRELRYAPPPLMEFYYY
jgi:hypothetical protein